MRLIIWILAALTAGLTVGVAGAGAASTQAPLTVLSAEDTALYREIFELQEQGRWKAADAKIAAIENDLLIGYVQHQRYMHPTAYRSNYAELKRWMAYYADHPEADKIYRLARKRRPSGAGYPLRPVTRKWRGSAGKKLHPALAADYEKKSAPQVKRIEGRVRHLANKNRALDALKEIDRRFKRGTITERQYDRMRSWIAASLYYQGYVDTAKEIAVSASRNGDTGPLAYWIAGLISYRHGEIAAAHGYFKAMAAVAYQEDSLRAAAGFWAARTALAAGAGADVAAHLEIAAAFPFEFYGQLALAQLGREQAHDWSAPMVTTDGLAALFETAPRVRRAIALAQVGRRAEADLELRWANGAIELTQDYDLLAVALELDLPAAAIDVALAGDAPYLQAGLFPIPHYAPDNGFKVDRALIYALMRQESKFKTEATSRVGARGLMQLMPRTASYIAKDRSLRRRGEKGRDRLYDPGYNLRLGQSYVSYLIDSAAEGDLFKLAAAYNGGPGNLRRWSKKMSIEDQLLFIESIPSRESRNFVEHVLTNFWVYRARLGQPAPSRERVAAGELPLYEALDQIAGD